jgi:hypothetical protein
LPTRWRELVAPTRLREAAQVLVVRTCEQLLVEVDDLMVSR